MSIIIDIIVIAIIALCTFLGIKRGLAGCIIKIASFVLAIVIAFILYKPVSTFIVNNTIIDDKLEESIVTILTDDVKEDGKIEKEDTQLSEDIVNYINESLENAATQTKDNIIKTSAHQITLVIVNIGSAILVFILAKIILIFVRLITKFITDLPIISQIDKTGGLIYGIIEGFIIVWLILAIISFTSPLIEDTLIIDGIKNSFLTNILYNNNLLLKIFF